jgi:ribosomal protein S27E
VSEAFLKIFYLFYHCNYISTSQVTARMRIECVVCRDHKRWIAFPQSPVTEECTHFPTTCLSCLQATVKFGLEQKQWEDIKCPDCGAVLQYRDLQRFADNETKKKLDNLIVLRAVQDDPEFRWACFFSGPFASLWLPF